MIAMDVLQLKKRHVVWTTDWQRSQDIALNTQDGIQKLVIIVDQQQMDFLKQHLVQDTKPVRMSDSEHISQKTKKPSMSDNEKCKRAIACSCALIVFTCVLDKLGY